MQIDIIGWVLALGCFSSWVGLTLPAIVYLLGPGWRQKRDAIAQRFTPEAIRYYFERFLATQPAGAKDFNTLYNSAHGRQQFLVPAATFSFVGSLTAGVVFVLVEQARAGAAAGSLPAAYALAGAYVWCQYDLLDRIRRNDLRPSDYYYYLIRLPLAVPFAYGLAGLTRADLALPLAFVLGSFPTATLFTLSRRAGFKLLGMGATSQGTASELIRLPNVGLREAERFSDEGLSTISALAGCDPLVTAIRTGFSFNYVADCQSQALAWLYFAGKTPELAGLGLRGAKEIAAFVDEFEAAAPGTDARARLDAVADAAAAAAGVPREALLHACHNLRADPSSRLLRAVLAG